MGHQQRKGCVKLEYLSQKIVREQMTSKQRDNHFKHNIMYIFT